MLGSILEFESKYSSSAVLNFIANSRKLVTIVEFPTQQSILTL